MRPALSLVLCTRDRARRLADCLDAIAAIECARPWELVVVDNGSRDETKLVLEEARGRLPVPLIVVSEPLPGITRARNLGWQSSSSEIVAFTDDDCYPATDFLERIATRFDHDPDLSFVGGAVELHNPDAARLGVATRREPLALRPGMFLTPGTILSASLAFRRRVLVAIGGFDPFFSHGGGPGGGDVDIAARALAAGWYGAYEPDIVVSHDHGRAPGPEADAVRRAYDLGRGAFYAKSALDPRMRRTYLAGWAVLTWGRIRRGTGVIPVARELRGAVRYLAWRVRSRAGARRVRS